MNRSQNAVFVSVALYEWVNKLTAIDTVDGRKCNEECQMSRRVMYTVQREHHGSYDGHCILAAINQVWKNITRIFISAKTL
jgi:hypothetical protein